MNNHIWEFRTLYNKTHYRLFAFWDKRGGQETVVIATHGLIKKSNKTPKSDMEKAEPLMDNYFNHLP